MAIAEKQAAKPDMSYGLVGELQLSQSGWLLLQVPNAIARGPSWPLMSLGPRCHGIPMGDSTPMYP